MREPVNPFLLTGYHSPRYFCDREKEFGWLMDQFDNDRNAVIHSSGRVGKTALLKHFFNRYSLGAASSVSAALQSLEKKEFIIFQDNRYSLHDTLLMRWLQQV